MNKLIECIPNFSEGKNQNVINQIIESGNIPEVKILDTEWNESHNRSLTTIVGSPEDVVASVYEMIKTATKLIDMEKHKGEHPRIGATDVVPFVPISGVSIAECIELAKQLGQKVANELHIPVYLYEEAATRPQMKNLADVRKGEYEGLKELITHDSSRKPDYGEAKMHPSAGAIVIGVRKQLIAYNINLDTSDIDIAKKIAASIREANGGLPGIKALGFDVDNHAQVSMNVTDYEKTNLDTVYTKIAEEANKYHTHINDSEIYGMIPLEAVVDILRRVLHAPHFSSEQILEKRIYA